VAIDPIRPLFFTACDKIVSIWESSTLELKGTLKAHKDEVRTIHISGNYLFTGGKGTNNSIRRMNINNLEILSPFEPPHMDSVTGLAIVKNNLISGSKDKNLRLWSLDHAINNSKNTLHAFNDYITSVERIFSLIKILLAIRYFIQDLKTDRLKFVQQKTIKLKF